MNQFDLIAGVDEVGRGPLAGDVVAAAVILDQANLIEGLTDSKKLTEKKRKILSIEIRDKAICWSLGRASVSEIDEMNILQASLLAMKRAIEGLTIKPSHCLIDGNKIPDIDISCEAIIKGDLKERSIGAASIIAKVERDEEMLELDQMFPGYGLAQHKGYPTKLHIQALQELGVTSIHRKSFAPVRKILVSQ